MPLYSDEMKLIIFLTSVSSESSTLSFSVLTIAGIQAVCGSILDGRLSGLLSSAMLAIIIPNSFASIAISLLAVRFDVSCVEAFPVDLTTSSLRIISRITLDILVNDTLVGSL